MDDLLAQNCQINHMFCDPNKWKVIYHGIFNPLSHQGRILKNSLEKRRQMIEQERIEKERKRLRLKRIKKMAVKMAKNEVI